MDDKYRGLPSADTILTIRNYMYRIEISNQRTVLTDPQRRVYNRCMWDSAQIFTEFEVLESEIPPEKIAERLDFWVDLNNYAVSQRGESSRNRYRVI
jgi:hypothetical protein